MVVHNHEDLCTCSPYAHQDLDPGYHSSRAWQSCDGVTVQAGRPPPKAERQRGAHPPEQARPYSLPFLIETPIKDPQQEQAMEFVGNVVHPGLQHLSLCKTGGLKQCPSDQDPSFVSTVDTHSI